MGIGFKLAPGICTIYRTQLAVQYRYDRDIYFYGRERSAGSEWRADRGAQEGRSHHRGGAHGGDQAGNTYIHELPFVTLDRQAGRRQAYAEFERRLAERSRRDGEDHDNADRVVQDDARA